MAKSDYVINDLLGYPYNENIPQREINMVSIMVMLPMQKRRCFTTSLFRATT